MSVLSGDASRWGAIVANSLTQIKSNLYSPRLCRTHTTSCVACRLTPGEIFLLAVAWGCQEPHEMWAERSNSFPSRVASHRCFSLSSMHVATYSFLLEISSGLPLSIDYVVYGAVPKCRIWGSLILTVDHCPVVRSLSFRCLRRSDGIEA